MPVYPGGLGRCNAFGLIEGADMKIAGVRAGKITDMKVDRRAKKALVEFEVKQTSGFRTLRTDVQCETRPQSLIGEYFIDCQPGSNPPLRTQNRCRRNHGGGLGLVGRANRNR